jgi:hypothetical protein
MSCSALLFPGQDIEDHRLECQVTSTTFLVFKKKVISSKGGIWYQKGWFAQILHFQILFPLGMAEPPKQTEHSGLPSAEM